MTVSLDRLIEDIKALDDAAGKATGFMLPDKLRTETVTALRKLLALLGGEGYGYPKPGDEKPAYPEPARQEYPKTVNDRTRKKSVKIRFVDKSNKATEPAATATKAALPVHFDRTPVSAEHYAILTRRFGADFASRYYVAGASKEIATGYEPVELIDHYFGVSKKTAQRRLEGQQQLEEQRQREAAEAAQRQRVVAGIASLFDLSAQQQE